ncbi:hypothetical protein EYF80_027722 [Liparis tanakae]|uniref:Uncharacterized protein n=1 Tax=Liparis tanakae TaxID=230148 RepID=A0A4Z2H8W5_9TELE|nr:hypothetical protein EYF80_027722 [Liparis tanakae]
MEDEKEGVLLQVCLNWVFNGAAVSRTLADLNKSDVLPFGSTRTLDVVCGAELLTPRCPCGLLSIEGVLVRRCRVSLFSGAGVVFRLLPDIVLSDLPDPLFLLDLLCRGSSNHSKICLTLAQGWFFSPIAMRTGSRTNRAASSSVPVGMVADTSRVWCSSGTSSKTSSTCCWKPIFNIVSTYRIHYKYRWLQNFLHFNV